jgi:3-isopropylmalate/(R)-2-methylmalate dehydratase small subunit
MQQFKQHTGIAVPLRRDHVDTDAIIPKQFLKAVSRFGFGQHLFDEWRYLDEGFYGQDCSIRPKNESFVLNQSRYEGASILVAGQNFGCGSSREHAPWAMIQYGFKAVIASSFADIFFGNSYKNGLLPIVLPQPVIDSLFDLIENNMSYQISIDLPNQLVSWLDKAKSSELQTHGFEITTFRKHCLINGLDEVGLTLQNDEKIKSFETQYFEQYPWLKQGINV